LALGAKRGFDGCW